MTTDRGAGRPPARSARARRGALRAGLVALVAAVLAGGCRYSVDLDPLAPAAESSEIVAADGTVLTTLDAGEHRVAVTLDRVAPVLRDAVVAIEDHRFYEHPGVDVRAVVRALTRDAKSGEIAEGGSTITQQYVRAVLVGREKTVRRKLREAVLAVQVEQRFSKDEILERYLNTIYFGNGAYGVEAAADRYFAKHAADLTLGEAALLAALIRAPERYNPYTNAEVAEERRDLVLEKMEEYGFAEADVIASARTSAPQLSDANWSTGYRAPHFVEQVKQWVLDERSFGETRDERRRLLFQGGLHIETTLDPEAQAIAEAAIAQVLLDPARDPAAALVAIEPVTGHVKAYVGGRDFFADEPAAKFDLASQSRRQAGSAFKPFVLAAALLDDVPLDRTYPAPGELTIPLRGQAPWVVHNYDGKGGGTLDLVDATVQSVNTVYAQLVMDVGPQPVVDLASAMGVKSQLAPYPSAALGTNGVSALDMASAYSTLAADGIHADPVFVTKVTDADGTVLYEESPSRDRVLPTEVARTVNAVLQQVVTRGTGVNARIGRPVAGKTGTGEEWRDAWFVGSTPELTTAVWIGFADAERSMLPPLTRAKVTGGLWPAQIWAAFTGGFLADTPSTEFPEPTGEEGVAVTPRAVPDVRGMPAARATELLTDAGFTVRTQASPNDQYPPGTVLGQQPEAHAAVPLGTEILLTTARLPQSVTVENLLGLLTDEASAAVEGSGLVFDLTVELEPPPGSPDRAGRVWKQAPPADTVVDEGTTIQVWVNP